MLFSSSSPFLKKENERVASYMMQQQQHGQSRALVFLPDSSSQIFFVSLSFVLKEELRRRARYTVFNLVSSLETGFYFQGVSQNKTRRRKRKIKFALPVCIKSSSLYLKNTPETLVAPPASIKRTLFLLWKRLDWGSYECSCTASSLSLLVSLGSGL